uniref:CRAL-TRIO domain-containing protein n=1 Tax=Lotus japonicus TaxID=34305 RepID=I3RZW4_LOTJA|nr:unknown [Lotus japonicus]
MNPSNSISQFEQEELLDKLEVFKIKGRDKQGRKILRIIGKFFPGKLFNPLSDFANSSIIFVESCFFLDDSARLVSVDVLKKYLEERIFPKLVKKKFSVLYVHTDVHRSENFPGISALRSIRRDPGQRQGESGSRLFHSPWPPVSPLPRHLRPLPLQRRVCTIFSPANIS